MDKFNVGDKVVFANEEARDKFFGLYSGNDVFKIFDVLTVAKVRDEGSILTFKEDNLYISEAESKCFVVAPDLSKQPRPHAELIKAWADGAEIQVKGAGMWLPASSPTWDADLEYRIKADAQVEEEYPELYKALCKVFTEEVAKKLLKGLQEDVKGSLEDVYPLSGAFVWSKTRQGHDFWQEVSNILRK